MEAQKLLKPLGFEVEKLEISYPEIQASELKEVAIFGIDWICRETELKGPVILEDAGLFIPALNDFPGVYSKHFFTTNGFDGILRLLKGKEDRGAYFESCVAYCEKGSEAVFFTGRVNGFIALFSKGEQGFGYDPIFIPEGEEKTFAEMETEEKNKYSHRARAFQQLAEYLGKR